MVNVMKKNAFIFIDSLMLNITKYFHSHDEHDEYIDIISGEMKHAFCFWAFRVRDPTAFFVFPYFFSPLVTLFTE